jgi:hypothetical protein
MRTGFDAFPIGGAATVIRPILSVAVMVYVADRQVLTCAGSVIMHRK